MRGGAKSDHQVYQACMDSFKATTKHLFTTSIPRKNAINVLLDIKFAQEIEMGSALLSTLNVSLKEPGGRRLISKLKAPLGFPVNTANMTVVEAYLHSAEGLNVGRLSTDFQLVFSYSGPCIFIHAVRLYYKQCPTFQSNLTEFRVAPAESGLQSGTCVVGSVEVTPPRRDCRPDGSWGPLQLVFVGHCRVLSDWVKLQNVCPM